jgi:hypothetical protein
VPASATVLYVDLNSSNPQLPYAGWATAATNIQDAVDAATNGDLVLVTNGVYRSGGRIVYGSLSNRVAVTKALTLQSVNGPNVTAIYGNNQGYGPYIPVRCVYLTNGAVLCGFTLTNGGTALFSSNPEDDGGGVWSESAAVVVSNCVITKNLSWRNGGGAYSGSLINCTLVGNSAAGGGGAASANLTNCVLSSNFGRLAGGGMLNCTVFGCSVIGNTAGQGGGAADSAMAGCTLSANSADSFGGGASGGALSNCIIIGNAATNGWPNPQGQGGGVYQGALNNCSVIGNAAGQGGGVASSSLTNCTLTSNTASAFGGGAWDGILQGCSISTNLARHGGGVAGGTLINCTLAGNSAHVADYSDLSDGGGAYGCPPGAWCSSFPNCTLVNCVLIGNTSTSHDGTGSGGGTSGCSLTNCLLSGNIASQGGGADQSALTGCTLVNNGHHWAAGAGWSTLNSCIVVSNQGYYGGGLLRCNVTNSALIGNSAVRGGGAAMSTLQNCTVVLNSAAYGGGVAGGTMNNCIIYSNTADNDEDGPNYLHDGLPQDPLILNYCCTTPLPTNGLGNITSDPLFVDLAGGNLRLQADSPCVNTGNNASVTNSADLDGGPRISGGVVDIGAYEFQFTPGTEVGRLILLVDEASLVTKTKHTLIASLRAAMGSFDRGHTRTGLSQLDDFERKVRSQVARSNPALANQFIAASQQIIEALTQ